MKTAGSAKGEEVKGRTRPPGTVSIILLSINFIVFCRFFYMADDSLL